MISIKKIDIRKFDFLLFTIMTILLFIGLYCVRQADLQSDEVTGLFKKQILGLFIGYVSLVILQFIDYRFILRQSLLLYIGIVIVLACTLKFGININNVHRWISIAGIPFQPSELAKIVLILFLASLCNFYKEKLDKFYVFFILAAVTAIPVVLILLEPHLSSSIVILFIFCVIIYSAGLSYKIIGTILGICVPLFLAIIISVGVFNVELPFIKSYQVNRILTFLSDESTEDSAGKYQQNQALAAISSGRSYGKLFTDSSSSKKYSDIYANESDFIFSIVGEEFGFVGCSIIITLYLILVIRCLWIGTHAPDYAGKLICIGVSAFLMFQAFANIGVALSILPNTGLPLPFISYGLTSLISSMLGVGLVLNIGLRRYYY